VTGSYSLVSKYSEILRRFIVSEFISDIVNIIRAHLYVLSYSRKSGFH
jgi:hypothetical protein